MTELQLFKKDGITVVSSRVVSEDFGKRHKEVKDKIEEKISGKSHLSNWFIRNTYMDSMNREQTEYLLTRDGFSFIVMGFTGSKADEFKIKYIEAFNKMEQALSRQLPTTYKEALLQLVDQVEQNEQLQLTNKVQEQRINELQPKATYYDLVLQNKRTLTVNQIAKDYGMSAIKLNRLLHELGVQYKQGKVWLLYAKHQDKGYTQSHTWVDDTETSRISTRWTQKGRLFIYELLKNEKNLLPLIEQSQESA